jgi:hypothetical protein
MRVNGNDIIRTERDIREMRAVEKAVDVLPYGEFNPRAKEAEAEARRKFREEHPVEEEDVAK